MKTFLIIDRTHDDFCIMQTNDPALAIGTCQVLTPYDCKQLEVWETEEDPDTALTYNTIYRWDVEHGRQLPAETKWLLFYHKDRFLGGYTLAETFEGEEEATKELYAEENGIRPDEITTRTVWK